MFGGGNKRVETMPRAATSVEGMVGPRMSVNGDLSFSGALHVDGSIKGQVNGEGSDSLLVVTERGSIEGTVRAPHIEMSGTMVGDIISTERLKLGASAKVRGNVYYKVLEMEGGCQINGQLVCGEEAQKQLPKPGSEGQGS
jgi:cytoskeletal protein CcmA (bactofilin family)